MVPEGWTASSLGECVSFKSGGTPSKKNPDFWGGEIPWVSAKDLKTHLISDAIDHLTKEGAAKAKMASPSDILMLVRGMTLLKDVPIGFVTKPVAFNQDLKALVPAQDIDPLFMSYLLVAKKLVLMGLVNTANHGTGRLDTDLLKSLPLDIPPLPEQRKIADILSTWDEAIEKTEALLTNARIQKRALMQQLLTGKRRFPEFEGLSWQEVRLGELCDIRRGASPRPIKDTKWFAEEGRGWVRISDVTASETVQLTKTTQYLSPEGVAKSVPVEPGELIMSICATIGVPRIIGIPVCIHDGFVVFRKTEGRINREFLYHFIELVTERLKNSGQPGTQKNLNTTIVGNIQVPRITLAEQSQIASVLDEADSFISETRRDITKLRAEKKALMQQLLTGKRRVKVEDGYGI